MGIIIGSVAPKAGQVSASFKVLRHVSLSLTTIHQFFSPSFGTSLRTFSSHQSLGCPNNSSTLDIVIRIFYFIFFFYFLLSMTFVFVCCSCYILLIEILIIKYELPSSNSDIHFANSYNEYE